MNPEELRAWRREKDEHNIADMVAQGKDPALPHPVCIWVYHDRADEAEVHRRLEALGWTAFATTFNESGWTGEDRELVLRARRNQRIDLAAVTAMQDKLIAALEGTSGEYSSWGPLEHGGGGSEAKTE
jgi:hypothetical protein